MERRVMHDLNYGMYVVSSVKQRKLNGQIANTVFQITAKPIQIATSINKENLTHEYIEDSGVFSVSILSTEAPFTLIGLFGFRSGIDVNKFEKVNYRMGITGAPIVTDYSTGYIEARVTKHIDAGTHTLFIGRVVDAGKLGSGKPMSYDYYHNVVKGKTPEKAATYLEVKK
ncbi:MAG: flavin reductase [Thermoplasmata archaeon]|nr:flavin reductase [Thermoplasmata archaeon]